MINSYTPGFSLVSNLLETARKTNACSLDEYTDQEIELTKSLFDEYIMYIWLHLGDTRFMKRGYQSAVNVVEETFKTIGEK